MLVGVALVILYVIYLRATWRSIGPIGLTLATAFLGALIWVTIDLGLLDLERPTIVTWVLLFALATILAIGISWSHTLPTKQLTWEIGYEAFHADCGTCSRTFSSGVCCASRVGY